MLKNHLQKILYSLTILGTFLCVSNISAEEAKLSPPPHPVNEICTFWTIGEWNRIKFPYAEFQQELLAMNLPLEEHEIKFLTYQCGLFARSEKIRIVGLGLEKIRKEKLEAESQ